MPYVSFVYWLIVSHLLWQNSQLVKLCSDEVFFQLWRLRYGLGTLPFFAPSSRFSRRPKNHHQPPSVQDSIPHRFFWGASWHNGDGNWNNYIVLLNNPLFGRLWQKAGRVETERQIKPEEANAREESQAIIFNLSPPSISFILPSFSLKRFVHWLVHQKCVTCSPI